MDEKTKPDGKAGSDEKTKLLQGMHNALNQLEVTGKQNCIIVIAVMNDIERLVAAIEKEINDGDLHDKP